MATKWVHNPYFQCFSFIDENLGDHVTGEVVFWGGSSYFSDRIFDQHEWHSWAFGYLRDDNDFAHVTLACEDDQQVEAHKVILAGQVLFTKLSQS